MSGFKSTGPLTVALSGASSAELEDVAAGTTNLSLSGSSHLSGKLTCTNVTIDLSGDSDVSLQGSATTLMTNGSGASDLALGAFEVDTADVNLSGASSARLFVNSHLRVNLSGASHIEYQGNPTLESVELSGSSSVTQA